MRTTLIVTAAPTELANANTLAAQALRRGQVEVVVAGVMGMAAGVRWLPGSRGGSLRAALSGATGDVVAVLPASASLDAMERLTTPLERGEADVVVGRRSLSGLQRLAAPLAQLTLGAPVHDPLSGFIGLSRAALDVVSVADVEEEEVEAALLAGLASELFRFVEVSVDAAPSSSPEVGRLRALVRHVRGRVEAHEGQATLHRLEAGAPRYNAWLGERFRRYAGARVLEIGAGIGTITAHLAPGRESVVALEVEPSAVRRLRHRFRGTPQVEVLEPDVSDAEAALLAQRHFDTVVLSNVLEHIADDGAAVKKFAAILPQGGRLLIFVPALPMLFGSIDEAVGHHRRYTKRTLRAVVEGGGFRIDVLEWMNLVGIPGWLVNGRLLKRRELPPLQLRVYDQLAPLLARAESQVRLPVGLSLFCVATR